MKRFLSLGLSLALSCLLLTSCTTWKSQSVVPFRCIVQSASDAVVTYEVQLDGKLVASGRTIPKMKGVETLEFTTETGTHELTVTAPGCQTWHKKISILPVVNYGQTFLIELIKTEK